MRTLLIASLLALTACIKPESVGEKKVRERNYAERLFLEYSIYVRDTRTGICYMVTYPPYMSVTDVPCGRIPEELLIEVNTVEKYHGTE